jgi:hypothetical protein
LSQPRIAGEALPNPLNHAPANPPDVARSLGFSCTYSISRNG